MQNQIPKCPVSQIDAYSESMLSYLKQKLRTIYGHRKPMRIFHAKSIGLVKAQVVVNTEKKTGKNLNIGIFKEEGKTYDAWVRFSNGNAKVSPDSLKAMRGMAIKILNVESTGYLDEDAEGKTQDIIMITAPNFLPGTADLQMEGIKVVLGGTIETLINFLKIIARSARGIFTFLAGQHYTANILEENYYSGTPYSFGEGRAIKWFVKRMKTITSVIPANASADFLRKQLVMDLSENARQNIQFELMVQFQENEATEPLENTAITWKTEAYRVAYINIPKQHFDTPDRRLKDDNMSFSPGHAVIEHKPLGNINTIRRYVYPKLATERRNHGAKKADTEK